MSSKMHYFRIRLLESEGDEEQILLGLKSVKVYKKWISSIELALKYNQFIFLIKPTPSNQQLIQVLDDDKGEITIYKRKIDNPNISPSKKNISIMNLKPQPDKQSNPSSKKSYGLKKTQEGSQSGASSENELKES